MTVTGQATTVDERNASTAIATVSAEELMVAPAKSIEGNLAGKVVGATIFENSGVPGGGMQIQIRGATSILGQGDPLYVVDGVIVSNASVARRSGVDLALERLDDVEPGPDGQPSRRHQSERHREHRSPEVGGGDGDLRLARHERRRRHHDEAGQGGRGALQRHAARRLAAGDAPPRLAPLRELRRRCSRTSAISPHADSIAKANCTPACPWYDWQGELYNNHSPSFETRAVVVGRRQQHAVLRVAQRPPDAGHAAEHRRAPHVGPPEPRPDDRRQVHGERRRQLLAQLHAGRHRQQRQRRYQPDLHVRLRAGDLRSHTRSIRSPAAWSSCG